MAVFLGDPRLVVGALVDQGVGYARCPENPAGWLRAGHWSRRGVVLRDRAFSGGDQTGDIELLLVCTLDRGHSHHRSLGAQLGPEMEDGTVLAWGQNDSGQLGDGTTTQLTTPS